MKTRNPFEFVRATFRSSPWVMISVSAHVIALAILALWYIAKPAGNEPSNEPIIVRPHQHEDPPDEVIELPPVLVRDAIPPQDVSILTDREIPLDLVTTPITEPPDPDLVVGDPNAISDLNTSPDASTAIGLGKGGHRAPNPSAFTGRPYGPRGPRGPWGEPVPTTRMDKLVLDGLRWLARHQNADGSWSPATLREHCTADNPCADPKQVWTRNYDEGVTGMALLAFLGAGFSHESQQWLLDPITHQRWKVGEVIKNGLRWLKNRQNADGSFTRDRAFLYNEALATLALTEAYGLTRNRFWLEPAQRGLEFLQRAQRPNPSGTGLWGWRYASRQEIEAKYPGGSMDEVGKRELFDADTSVTGWVVMALKSAQLAELPVAPEAMQGALSFAKFVSTPEGRAGYLDPKGAGAKVSGVDDHFEYHAGSMSALAMCIRTFTAHDPGDPFLEPAARNLVADLPDAGKDHLKVDYYYWYYGSLALHQFDGPDSPKASGKYWGPWNKSMVAMLTELQDQDPKTCHHGGWLVPDRWCHSGGPVYATAINVLTAEVYYRYANAFGGRRH